MFFKTAICKSVITEITNKNQDYILHTAGKHWIDVNDFPTRYQRLFSNYITANKIRVGKWDSGFSYFHVRAMTGDIPNDNWDLFRWGSMDNPDEPELLRFDKDLNKQVYSTFIGRGNYKNHENDDVAKAVGIILDVAPNYNGKFIEALLAVDKQKDPELLRGIESGYIDSVSMGALCGHSLCTVCGNKAHNEREYCDHIKYNKGRMISHNGTWVRPVEDNRQVNFIELSWVGVPADRDAKLLSKVAQNISLSDDALIMYNAIKQAMNDARLVTSGIEEYDALLQLINRDIQQGNI